MEKSEWKGILIYLELNDEAVAEVSLELISEGHKMASELNTDLYAVAIGSFANKKIFEEQVKKYPIKKVYFYENEEAFIPEVYADLISDGIKKCKPSIVLIGATLKGRSFAPRVAVEFKTGLTADCTELEVLEGERLIQTRPAFGGNIMASIETVDTRPQIATVREHIMELSIPEIESDTEILYICKKKFVRNITVQERKKKNKSDDDIRNAKVIVVAGKGIKRKEDMQMLYKLANLLGGKVAASRGIVEKGWIGIENQIGLSGNTVVPKLMITCGVSGSIQFMTGMRKSKCIIAIDTDENAKIFEVAHYPICKDLYEVIPKIIEELENE